ncbi:DNA binding protein [Aureococcus anophagefferens]|nr:DNA binding protein [Aureococcus anophagefferens]
MASRRSTPASRNTAALPEQGEAPNMKPRRRREQSEASAFLSKTYAMINGLDGTVGGWSDAGDSMVILDAENFASEVIPQYFKHNNFRSFVRQLNFYGFRKLRADPSAGPRRRRWEFKHVNFRRAARASAQPLTSFETARLDSLIRTLSDEREQNDNAARVKPARAVPGVS